MAFGSGASPIVILLAEDNPADVRLVEEVLREGHLASQLHVARDGVETMQFLRREGRFHDAPPVQLLWLDLNMPRKDGREVLREVKSDADLRTIPVVVMTSSIDRADVHRSYADHANCYIRKPVDYHRLREVAEKVREFWTSVAELPSN
jgi:chemotaxis family two-component system response regulator Rcp1